MNKQQNFFSATVGILLASMCSCSSQSEIIDSYEESKDLNQPHTCNLILNISNPGYDSTSETRSGSGWENGDRIFLLFSTQTESSRGDAVYKDGVWTVSYYGSLDEGNLRNCSAVYFDNADYESGTIVNLTGNTGIYEDTEGSYIFNDETLTVTAALKPKTARVRFAGSDGDEIKITGVTHYSSYDTATGKFECSVLPVELKVAGGYTPYIYGFFPEGEQSRMSLISKESGFTKILSESLFQPGQSGYMTIPSIQSHGGWENIVTLQVKGVEFNMIPVEYKEGNFLMAETETTNELYNVVMGENLNPAKKPCSLGSDNLSDNFMATLSVLVGLPFDYPTLEEWQFAARGGNRSKGYTYSGSDIIDEVAWYSNNSGIDYHEVRQLQPNELGFYDMSGNLRERVINSFDNAKTSVGGYYYSQERECRVNDELITINNTSYTGLRFVVRLK